MGSGTLALACMSLVLGQFAGPSGPEVMHTNQKNLRIPVNFENARRNELRDLLLFASWDQGRNWQQVASMAADKGEFFTFSAQNDGNCWLRVAVITRQGKQEPDNIQQGPPDQKLVIDTFKPVMKSLTTQRQGDEVVVSWEIQEDHPDWQQFRLEYQPRDNQGAFWSVIQATPGPNGQARFRPTTNAPLIIRLSAKDLAGNASFNTAEVTGTGVNLANYNTPAAPMGAGVVPQIGPPPVPPNQGQQAAAPPPPSQESTSRAAPPPPPPPAGNTWAPTGGVPPPLPNDGIKGGPANSGINAPNVNAILDANTKLVASSTTTPQGPAVVANPSTVAGAGVPKKPLPPLQYVNHPEVVLEYELAKVGPSGVGNVDLWWTQNDGESWELYAVDPDIKGTTKSGRYQRTVELPGDGVYGFILVVKSRAGLGKAPPRAGETPDIRVEVDTVSPLAQLYSPIPEPQRANTLLLKWAAKDNNLTSNPITLEWSERRDGPWSPIATNIANNGRHAWQLPDQLPVQVYMRLRVKDCAGNESIAVTPEPQLVDLSEPEGKLLNVSVTPRR